MPYTIKLDVFEGPFDLLVYLIEKAKVDIYDIPIAHITEQYLSYIKMMGKVNLEVMSEFLLLAATLIEIKSKMLLPRPKIESQTEEDMDDPRLSLVEKILEYKRFKYMADLFKGREEEALKIKYKVQEDLDNYIEDYNQEYINIDLDDFVKAFNIFLQKQKKIRLYQL